MNFATGILSKIILPAFYTAALILNISSPVLAQTATPRQQIQYYRLAPQGIADTLTKTQGKKVLYLYAATSPNSRQTFSDMLSLTDRLHREKFATVLAVSLDTNVKDLDRLLNIYARIPFLPVIAVQTHNVELRRTLSTIGIRFDNTLPFVAVLDESNHVLDQGLLSAEEILNVVLPPEKIVKKRTSVYDEMEEEEEAPEPEGAPDSVQQQPESPQDQPSP